MKSSINARARLGCSTSRSVSVSPSNTGRAWMVSRLSAPWWCRTSRSRCATWSCSRSWASMPGTLACPIRDRSRRVEPCADRVVCQLRAILHHGTIEVRRAHGSVGVHRHLHHQRHPVLAFAEGREVRRQPFGQHGEHRGGRVHRGGVVLRVPVRRRALRDRCVHVGDRHQNPYHPTAHRFCHGELIEIPRIIVVDRAPEESPQIPRPRGFLGGRRLAPSDFRHHGRRKVR